MSANSMELAPEPSVAAPSADVAGERSLPEDTQPPKGLWRWVTPFGLAYAVVLLAALVMRLWDLGAMAVHHDESLHATYGWYLYSGRGYQHNPMMHGPYQFFANAGMFSIFGDNTFSVRLAAAFSGTALVATPLLFTRHLGKLGALATAVLLAVSPTLLYFSRFTREDMHVAFWTVMLIGFMWLYLDTKKVRYLALGAGALALVFSVKESAYLLAVVLGSYLFLAAMFDILPWIAGRKSLRAFSPPGEFLIMMASLLLPFGAALLSLAQKPLGVTLANDDWTRAAIGIPIGPGLFLAFGLVVILLLVGIAVGLRWRPRAWLLCAAVFWTVWMLLFSSFFTNVVGLGSGLWQSLGYWAAQQDVARGGQPWYYYLVIGLNYEFLALLVGGFGAAYFTLKRDRFGMFLAFWSVMNFLAFAYASEKMPWLLVHITIPFIFLAGMLMGRLLSRLPWRKATSAAGLRGGLQGLRQVHWPAVGFTFFLALLVAAIGWLLLLGLSRDRVMVMVGVATALATALALTVASLWRLLGKGKRLALVGASIVIIMLAMTVPSAFRAAYANPDVPVEMLVYTQSAPDIPQLMSKIDQLAVETGKGKDLKILVDSTDGFSWPWAWYLRDYQSVTHLCFSSDPGCTSLSQAPDADVVLLSERSTNNVDQYMGAYGPPVRYKHRWWFPESYRGITPSGVLKALRSRESLCKVADYFVFREFGQSIGSVDSYAYFPKGFDLGKIGKDIAPPTMHC